MLYAIYIITINGVRQVSCKFTCTLPHKIVNRVLRERLHGALLLQRLQRWPQQMIFQLVLWPKANIACWPEIIQLGLEPVFM